VAGEPDLGRTVATLRVVLDRSRAVRAVVLVDRGEDAPPVIVDCDAEGVVEVAEGDEPRDWPEEWLDAEPFALPVLGPVPALTVDLAEGTVTAPLGGLDNAALAVRALSGLLPGRSVATVGFATNEPEVPLFLAAREGEALVASLAGDEYELPADWP
jgi:hypothetical protein